MAWLSIKSKKPKFVKIPTDEYKTLLSHAATIEELRAQIAAEKKKTESYERQANTYLEETRRLELENNTKQQKIRSKDEEIRRLKKSEEELKQIKALEKKAEITERKLYFSQKKLAKHLALMDIRISSLIKQFREFAEKTSTGALKYDNHDEMRKMYHGPNGNFSEEQRQQAKEQNIDLYEISPHNIKDLIENLLYVKKEIQDAKALCLEEVQESDKLKRLNKILEREILVEYDKLDIRTRLYNNKQQGTGTANIKPFNSFYEQKKEEEKKLLHVFEQKIAEEKHIEELNEKQLIILYNILTQLHKVIITHVRDNKEHEFFYPGYKKYANVIENTISQIVKQIEKILKEDERAIDRLFVKETQLMRIIEKDFKITLEQ